MTISVFGLCSRPWGRLHPSVFQHAATLSRWVPVKPRSSGALRYRCPVTGSFVLVTDDETLPALAQPRARLRCPTCNERHLLTHENAGAIVATRDQP